MLTGYYTPNPADWSASYRQMRTDRSAFFARRVLFQLCTLICRWTHRLNRRPQLHFPCQTPACRRGLNSLFRNLLRDSCQPTQPQLNHCHDPQDELKSCARTSHTSIGHDHPWTGPDQSPDPTRKLIYCCCLSRNSCKGLRVSY